jgi:hypothetical protein
MDRHSSAEAWREASFAAKPMQLESPHVPQFVFGKSL